MILKRLVYCLLSALLILLSFPPGPAPYLAWIAHVPYFVLLAQLNMTQTVNYALIYGPLIWYICSWWFVVGVHTIGDVSYPLALAISILPSLVGSLPYILFSLCSRKLNLFTKNPNPLLAALLLTALTVFIPNFFAGNLAHTQYQNLQLIQIAGLAGVPALLLGINLTNCLVASAILAKSKKTSALYLSLATTTFLAIYLYGNYSLKNSDFKINNYTEIKIGLIQPNIPVTFQELPQFVDQADRNNNLDTAINLSRELVQSNPQIDLLAWPEIPLSFSIINQPNDFYKMEELLKSIAKPLLISAFYYSNEIINGAPPFYNSVHLLFDKIEGSPTYRKNILIPFGEYLPMENYLPWLRELLPSVRRYTAADEIKILELNAKVRIGTAICLEAVFPSHIENLVLKGANIIINPTNDAYFGRTAGPWVHLALATFRAVEFGIPLVRVTNSGVSQVIDRNGKFLLPKDQRLFQKNAWVTNVSVPTSVSTSNPTTTGRIALLLLLVITSSARLVFRTTV